MDENHLIKVDCSSFANNIRIQTILKMEYVAKSLFIITIYPFETRKLTRGSPLKLFQTPTSILGKIKTLFSSLLSLRFLFLLLVCQRTHFIIVL
jgi:hypothetical protein